MLRLVSFADLISISNAIFGFLSILVLISDVFPDEIRLRVSLSFIFLGLIADGMDGMVARRFKQSNIGEYLESMGDMTTLVIAPSVFIYFIYSDYIIDSNFRFFYLFFALALFLFFGIIRLASFHIMKEKGFFVGLPASASTIILLIMAYFEVDFIFILPAVIIIGAFMASNIVFLKPSLKMNIIAGILILLTLVFDKSFYGFAPLVLFIAIIVYAFGGVFYINFFKKCDKNISK